MSVDWYRFIRRVSLVAFVVLTFWGAMEAYGQTFFWLDASWQQYLYIVLWPITNAPMWYKFAFFGLSFWLIFPYLWIIEFSR